MSINVTGTAVPINIDALPDAAILGFATGNHVVKANSQQDNEAVGTLAALPLTAIPVSVNQSVNAFATAGNLALPTFSATVVATPISVGTDVTSSTAVLTLIPNSAGGIEGESIFLETIPNLAVLVDSYIDMSQYINDPYSIRISTNVTGLSVFASYDSGTERLMGVSEGIETGVELEVTY